MRFICAIRATIDNLSRRYRTNLRFCICQYSKNPHISYPALDMVQLVTVFIVGHKRSQCPAKSYDLYLFIFDDNNNV